MHTAGLGGAVFKDLQTTRESGQFTDIYLSVTSLLTALTTLPTNFPPLTSVKQGTFGKGLKGSDQFWASPPLPQLGACRTLSLVSVGANPSCPPGEEDARARTAPAGVSQSLWAPSARSSDSIASLFS